MSKQPENAYGRVNYRPENAMQRLRNNDRDGLDVVP
jgi:hypothetical protein